uniref:ras-related protein Rap-1b-like n=1 Tax=Myxine glutinosa TaxID=7769 RepID=UPI00358F85A9
MVWPTKETRRVSMAPQVGISRRVRLTFLGAQNVGKTSLIQRFVNGSFDTKHNHTLDEASTVEYEVNGRLVQLEIMDTSGSFEFPAMRRLSIEQADAFALVYSIDDPASFEVLQRLRDEVIEVKQGPAPPMIVIGNKLDLDPHYRKVRRERVIETVEDCWSAYLLETSAKENHNVFKAFQVMLTWFNLPCREMETTPNRRRITVPELQVTGHHSFNKKNSCNIS